MILVDDALMYIDRDLALGLLCSYMVYLDYINYRVLVDSLPIILV